MKNIKIKIEKLIIVYALFFTLILKVQVLAKPMESIETNNLKQDIESYLTLTNFAGTQEIISPYVVGSILITVNPTNPGTYLGGTWQSFGIGGQCLFGYHSSNTLFNTLGKTGGATYAQLTATNMPKHTHSFTVTTRYTSQITDAYNRGWHTHIMRYDNNDSTKWYANRGEVQVDYFTEDSDSVSTAYNDGWHQHEYNIQIKGTIQNAGSGYSFNILNPYVVVYMWKKTA